MKYIEVLDPAHIALIPANHKAFKVEFIKLLPGESIGDRIIGRVIWAGQSFIAGVRPRKILRPTDAPS